MIKVEKTTKIYVFCKAKYVTGGTELLHQLVDLLNNNNLDAYIHYDEESSIPERFLKYNVKIATNIVDSKENIIVLPETKIYECNNYSQSTLIFWWLSVDNFYGGNLHHLSLLDILRWNKYLFFKAIIGKLYYIINPQKLNSKIKISIKKLSQKEHINLYQSQYAKNYLEKANFKNIKCLSDYLNKDLMPIGEIPKSNIVIYNPKKGLNFTKKIIRGLKGKVEFIALEKFNNEELKSYFQKAKLYIDFGSHPGKDRMPREAVINNCCIITSRNGSANFYEDIPISDRYKFEDKNSNLSEIENLILDILTNYENHKGNFTNYKNMVTNEEEVFRNNVRSIFGFD